MHIDIYTRALTSKYRSNDASLADTLPLCDTLLSVTVIVWVQFAFVYVCVLLLDACFDVLSMEFRFWMCERTYTNAKTTGPYQCTNPNVWVIKWNESIVGIYFIVIFKTKFNNTLEFKCLWICFLFLFFINRLLLFLAHLIHSTVCINLCNTLWSIHCCCVCAYVTFA